MASELYSEGDFCTKVAEQLNRHPLEVHRRLYELDNLQGGAAENTKSTNKQWTDQEIETLRNTKSVVDLPDFPGKTIAETHRKYFSLMQATKGKFTQEEDNMIIIGVKLYGTQYCRLEQMLRENGAARSAVQIRERYQVLMKGG